MQTFYCHVSVASCSASITVPARKPWAAATYARWVLAAQHIVHTAVAVLWMTRVQGREMQLPYELVEISTEAGRVMRSLFELPEIPHSPTVILFN